MDISALNGYQLPSGSNIGTFNAYKKITDGRIIIE